MGHVTRHDHAHFRDGLLSALCRLKLAMFIAEYAECPQCRLSHCWAL